MNTFICKSLIIISFFVLALSCANQKNRENNMNKDKKSFDKKESGKIVFDKKIHNFGTLKVGEIVSFSFKFRNAGGSPFHIVEAEKSCGCISVQYSNNTILPGESSLVEVVFDTANEWGNLIKCLTIETSAGERQELQIGAYIENKQFNNLLNTQK